MLTLLRSLRRFNITETSSACCNLEIMSHYDERGGRGGRRPWKRGGYRGHQRGYGSDRSGYRRNNWGEQEDDRDGARGEQSNRPPPGLKGREIGMWYAKRSNHKKREQEMEQRPVVNIEGQAERKLRNLLDNIQDAESVPPQPARSGASIDMDLDNTTDRPSTSFGSQRDSTRVPVRPQTAGSRLGNDQASWDSWGNTNRASAQPQQSTSQDEDLADVPNLEEVRQYDLEEMDVDFTLDQQQDFALEKDGSNTWDQELLDQRKHKKQDPRYKSMISFRKKLPSYESRKEILDLVNSNQVLVISGETGCGKTTQVPQFILDDYIKNGKGSSCKLICTQPRRISAISVAERVADERAEGCGNSVGYSIRLESKLPRKYGSILYCTTGILIKYLESDPMLTRASHIVIDEIHERDLLSDFLLIILKDLLPRRPDIKLILMSATLNAEQFSKYFNGCPMINIPGFTYPVKEYYLEDCVELTSFVPTKLKMKKNFGGRRQTQEQREEEWNLQAWSRNLKGDYSDRTIHTLMDLHKEEGPNIELMHDLIKHISLNMGEGAILVFVPGWAEISDLSKSLNNDSMFRSDNFKIIPLHSLMPTINQKEIFNRPPKGVRKIVLATNIAETSITIDDVVYVIDGGKIKVKDFDPESNMSSLQSKWVSKANAKQRRGRAGRVQPGECFHLYSSFHETTFNDYLAPEILRTPLEELCLNIKLLKLGMIEPFVSKAMQKPPEESVHLAIKTLQDLQALDEEENLLPLGRHLARMPVDPHSGKMILCAAMFGCLDPVCIVAASLSFKNAFYIPLGQEARADHAKKELAGDSKSDHIMLINAYKGWERADSRGQGFQFCRQNFLSVNTLQLLKGMKKQFADLLYDLGFLKTKKSSDPAANVNSKNENLIKAIICAGLYPNVAKILKPANRKRHTPPKLAVQDGRGKILVHPGSVNSDTEEFESAWMIYHKMMKTSNVFVYDCSMISPYPLLFFGGKIGVSQTKHGEVTRDMVTIDNWISFYASRSTIQIVKDLRHQLDLILEEKIVNTGETNWSPKSKEGAILRAIIDLITTEEVQQYRQYSAKIRPTYYD